MKASMKKKNPQLNPTFTIQLPQIFLIIITRNVVLSLYLSIINRLVDISNNYSFS